jgi:hypothetical protein
VGVPPMTPVDDPKESPGGRAPLATSMRSVPSRWPPGSVHRPTPSTRPER